MKTAAKKGDLQKENEALRKELREKDRALNAFNKAKLLEETRAKMAAEVLQKNSAIQKLLVKKSNELADMQAKIDSLSETLQLAETELFQAQKMEAIGRLAAGVAHEINTPIQFVNDSIFFIDQSLSDLFGLVEELAACTDIADPQARAERVRKAKESFDFDYLKNHTPQAVARASEGISRVAEITRSMKSFSHPDRTTMTLVDINEGLRNTLAIARNEYKYVADLVTDFGNLPMVTCLGGEINQVFLNIVVNAAHAIDDVYKASGNRGTITISTREEGGHVVIGISDTGTGIPTEVQDRVFDHFFTTKAVGKGTGQGLSIAQKVVCQLHHGDISFKTEPGQGTTFTVRLPIDHAEDAEQPIPEAA